jgi:gamma-glutamyltranspeptidase / glutathione hydrolase
MYTGEWARRFVEIVGREGGKVTLDDMARYQPIWSAPSRVTYHGHDVVSLGEPSFGGIETLASLITRQV